ncbi:MAG: serine hydrolase [Clostridiaceae bacterium]|nr:serine hydrolase [Clostridiaceae bacterium]
MKTRKFYSLILKFFILTVFYPAVLCSIGESHNINRDYLTGNIDFVLDESYLVLSELNPDCLPITAKFPISPGKVVDRFDIPEHISDYNFKPLNGILGAYENVTEEAEKTLQQQESPADNLSSQEQEKELLLCGDNNNDPQFCMDIKDIADKAAGKSNIKNLVGVYVKELKTGYEFGINENLTVFDEYDGNTDGYFRAASVVKLQMAYVAYRLIEKGELSVDKTYYDNVTNQEFMLLPTLHKMVSHSDNNLFNTMLRLIGRERTNRILEEYGILNSPVYGEISPAVGYSRENNIKRHGTTKVGGKITPKDMGKILEDVYKEKDENYYMECLNRALVANVYNSRIPAGFDYKYPVAHKTGTADSAGAYNDAGIIYCKNPFILVVLTKGESSANAQKYIRELAKELTAYMDKRASKTGQ